MSWYIIYTKPNNEKKIVCYLIDKGFDVYCPMYQEIRQWSDRKKNISVPLFKSYIFLFLNNYKNESSIVLNIPGVIRFIWWAGKPGIVRDEEILEIKKFLNEHDTNQITIQYLPSAGDTVLIKEGALMGRNGTFLNQKGRNAILEIKTIGCKLIAMVNMKDIEPKEKILL